MGRRLECVVGAWAQQEEGTHAYGCTGGVRHVFKSGTPVRIAYIGVSGCVSSRMCVVRNVHGLCVRRVMCE